MLNKFESFEVDSAVSSIKKSDFGLTFCKETRSTLRGGGGGGGGAEERGGRGGEEKKEDEEFGCKVKLTKTNQL